MTTQEMMSVALDLHRSTNLSEVLYNFDLVLAELVNRKYTEAEIQKHPAYILLQQKIHNLTKTVGDNVFLQAWMIAVKLSGKMWAISFVDVDSSLTLTEDELV